MKNNYSFKKTVFTALFVFAFIIFAMGAIQQYETGSNKQDLKQKVETKKQGTEEVPENEEPGPADTVMIGAYVLSVYDLDFPNNKVNVDFYLWYNALKDSLELLQYIEVVNATEFSKTAETDERRGEIIYQTVRINSQIKASWNVTNFPFDQQRVEIYVEDFDKDNTKIVFIADTIGSKIDKSIHIEGWEIKNFGIKTVENAYETNYGDPDIPIDEYSSYSRVVIHFTIEREGNGLFFKLFIGLFISVLISLLTFFVNPLDLDPRFGLSVGAIFAAIASQYVITSTLPQNARLTLVDILHDVSFIFIFLCILVSTISLHYMKNGKEKQSKKLDWYSFLILSICYVILVSYFVTKAFN
jgi:hypothetical protein